MRKYGFKKHVLFGLGLLGTFQPDDQGDFKIEFLGGFDHTLGDVVATHDTWYSIGVSTTDSCNVKNKPHTSKDVNEDTLDFGVG